MTAHSVINFALAGRNMLPMDGHCACACCGLAALDQEEIASTGTHKAHFLRAVEELHRGRVCIACMDAHTFCGGCDRIADETTDGLCRECSGEAEIDTLHTRSERHGWEQV